MTTPGDVDDLQASGEWDWDAASIRPGEPGAGVRVSLRFTEPEFDALAQCAERAGLSVAGFIHQAALDAAEALPREG